MTASKDFWKVCTKPGWTLKRTLQWAIDKGEIVEVAAVLIGIDRKPFREKCHELGIKMPPPGKRPTLKNKLIGMHTFGRNPIEIAREAKCSAIAVRKYRQIGVIE